MAEKCPESFWCVGKPRTEHNDPINNTKNGCSNNKIGACCKKQTKPDYAFENDRTDRILAGKTV